MKNKDSKGKRQFKFFLRIYAGVLAIAAIVVCAIVWIKLKSYQNSYDESYRIHNPENYVNEFVEGLDYDSFLYYIKTYGINMETGINPEENHAAYFAECTEKNKVTFEKNEKYASLLPVYDIYAGDTRIAVISLKSDGNSDSFGFHDWKLKDIAFDTDKIEYSDIEIIVPEGASVTYNGQALTDEYITETGVSKDIAAAQVVKLGGIVKNSVVYCLENTFGNRDIKAECDGTGLTAVISDNTYDFTGTKGGIAPADIEQRVFDTIDSYIYTIYNHKSFDETSAYIEYGSDAYAIITDVLASVAWGWTPDTIDILEQSVTDYVPYGENIFACSYFGKIYKYEEDAMESGEETFNYRLVFRKFDGQWYLNYFVII